MSPGATNAVIIFLAGLLLLLGWVYATADNPRSGAMLRKSLLVFALPVLFLSPAPLFNFPLSMWVLVACEEGLKAFASTRERSRIDKFWLVSLFGIWELTLFKPVWGIVWAEQEAGLTPLALGNLIYTTALPVLMHAVTAAIYAFTFRGRLWAAFTASWLVHVTFNESVFTLGLSPTLAMVQTTLLAFLLMALVQRRTRPGEAEHL